MKTPRALRVRANPRLIVLDIDALDGVERQMLEDLRQDPAIFGVASVPSRGASLKAISRPTVDLLRALDQPRELGDGVVTDVLLDDAKAFTRLVLDDFLQVEQDGAFVGGPGALGIIPQTQAGVTTDGPLSRLSDDALRYGARLGIRIPQELAWKLYTYNTAPQSPRWRARLRGLDDLVTYLGIGEGSPLGTTLSAHWVAPNLALDGAWWTWTSRRTIATPDPEELSAKLYVSPALGALPSALRLAVPVLLDHDALAFKLGAGLQHLLRPDKLVVYFGDRSRMLRCAVDLVTSLGSLEPQGVPFTASVEGSSLVSWGVDPPHWAHLLKWRERDSWRTWLTDRLARYLIAAGGAHSACAPWEYAVVRLALDGVDTSDWTPEPDLWSRVSTKPAGAADDPTNEPVIHPVN